MLRIMQFHPIEIAITSLVVFVAAAYLVRYTYGIVKASKCQRSGCDTCKAKIKPERAKRREATTA